jgi:hypothetical protein
VTARKKRVVLTAEQRRALDDALDDAVELVVSVLGGVVLPAAPCQYGGCKATGAQHRNGVWCRKHERAMERVVRDG